uniref:Uncharacterized protein n=1 Tax=Moorena producens (strain JHB) TaxID=1454205 RepID=A0A1D9G9R5_MOOP1
MGLGKSFPQLLFLALLLLTLLVSNDLVVFLIFREIHTKFSLVKGCFLKLQSLLHQGFCDGASLLLLYLDLVSQAIATI